MVMGPNAADSTMLWGIYFGQPSHTVTPLEGIVSKIGKVPYSKACEITSLSENQSIFDKIANSSGSKGLYAEYWNNVDMEAYADRVYDVVMQKYFCGTFKERFPDWKA